MGCASPAGSPAPAKAFAPSGGLDAAGTGEVLSDVSAGADAAATADGPGVDFAEATEITSDPDATTETASASDAAIDSAMATDADAPADADAVAIGDAADADAADVDSTVGTDSGAETGGVDAAADSMDASTPIPSGPGLVQLGAACPGWEGEPTCSNDKKWRLECVNGAWTPQQHCGFGLCKLAQTTGGAPVTTCGVPPASDPTLSKACARLFSCFDPGISHQACVRRAAEPSAMGIELGIGRKLTVPEAAVLELGAVANCAASAANCADLAQCFQFFLAPKCGSTGNSGCDGDIAWTCAGQSSPLAVNCKGLGMQCFKAANSVSCVNPAPCPGGAQASTCTGQTALQCLAGSDGKVVGLTSNCLETAGTCQPNVAAPGNPCSGPAVPCKADVPPAQCLPGPPSAVLICSPGSQVATPCPSNTKCLLEDQFGQLAPTCPAGQVCLKGECGSGGPCSQPSKCVNGSVWFCEKGWPASFDCMAIGKTCVVAASGPRCQ